MSKRNISLYPYDEMSTNYYKNKFKVLRYLQAETCIFSLLCNKCLQDSLAAKHNESESSSICFHLQMHNHAYRDINA